MRLTWTFKNAPHHLRVERYLLGQTDAVTDLKRQKKTDEAERSTARQKQINAQTNLLSVIVGLEDIADGSAVTSPPR